MFHHPEKLAPKKYKHLKALCYFSLVMSAADLSSATYSRSTTADSLAAGTLRNAILLASDTNVKSPSSTITFNLVPTTGTINLLTDSLPPIGSLASSPAVNIIMDMNGNKVLIYGALQLVIHQLLLGYLFCLIQPLH